jgi:murein DD-endopeptidase MepM/ murein hydrolase activator NlpD
LLAASTVAAAPPERTFIMPPKAAPASGAIGDVLLSPIFAQDFMCSEHFEGQIPYAGDALGSDCMIVGGVSGDSGFERPFRTDGRTNADWYGWSADVLSPTAGIVAGIHDNPVENAPGVMGRPPASMVQIRRDDGVIVTVAHVTAIAVQRGQRVAPGDKLAKVGNNGFARNPHIHIGAWREATVEPLQIRWDLQAMAKLRGR